jgi:transposase
MLTPEEQTELQRVAQDHIPIRAIARRLGRDVKTIRRALGRPAPPPAPAKLTPYEDRAKTLYAQGLFAPRILRELQAQGYTGSLSLLKAFLRTLEPRRSAPRRLVQRFETRPGEEAQSDWSPYRLAIGGRQTLVHAFSLLLGFSRRLFIAFFPNERLPILLWAHLEAFRYHGGLCHRIAYDNQTGAALLRHPAFADLVRSYAARHP